MGSGGADAGFIVGGALCMELLSDSGWSPVLRMTGVMQSIRMIFMTTRARLDLPKDTKEEVTSKKRAREVEQEPILGLDADQMVPDLPVNDELQKKRCLEGYSENESKRAFDHIEKHHKKHGWHAQKMES